MKLLDLIFGKRVSRLDEREAHRREHHETNGSAAFYGRLLDRRRR